MTRRSKFLRSVWQFFAQESPSILALVDPDRGVRVMPWAITRLIHRPIGLSGSGPTLWALYASVEEAAAAASVVEAAVASGDLPIPGDGAPFVAATTIETDGGTSA